MGVATDYGQQKQWFYGLPFDGMNKNNSSKANFGIDGTAQNDFIFAQDKQVASHTNAGATATATMTITFHPPSRAIGHATGTVIRRIGGVTPNYDQSRFWLYGASSPGLHKKDPGVQSYWLYGGLDADLPPLNGQGGFAIAGSTASASLKITFHVPALAIGRSSAKVVRAIGGATDPQGGQKFWSVGQAMGMTFFALSNSVNTTNKALFADQRLWYYGLATPDIIGTVATPVVTVNPSKIISSQMQTKTRTTGWPTSVKVISAAIPNKRSSG